GVVGDKGDIQLLGSLEEVPVIGILSDAQTEVVEVDVFLLAIHGDLMEGGARIGQVGVFSQVKVGVKVDDSQGLTFFDCVQMGLDAIVMPIGHIVSPSQDHGKLFVLQ